MAKQTIFITGTDTDVGKTYITTGLLRAFRQQGYSAIGIKPVSSGCKIDNGELKNIDALMLQEASSVFLPYQTINPFAFEPRIAPHIAAQQQNQILRVNDLIEKTQYARDYPADICLIEGAGGWHTPLNDKETMADFVEALNIQVLLVVGVRLGCINHAILTYQAIQQKNITVVGWIANVIDSNMQVCDENIQTLRQWISAPCLGVVEFGGSVHVQAEWIKRFLP